MSVNDILAKVDHRPFPLPPGPWIMKQSWRNLLFAHWPVSPQLLRSAVPECLEIDTFDGAAWVGVVPFSMNDVCPRWVMPLPWISNFLELNVRTYVKKNGVAGVYFFSLDCSNPVAVRGARTFFHLPYYDALMTLKSSGSHSAAPPDRGEISYTSVRASSAETFKAVYAAEGPVVKFESDSMETFLTERYCLYTTDRSGRLFRGVIHHLPWPLQRAQAEISQNTMVSRSLGFELPNSKPHLLYSANIETVEWPLQYCNG